jgi:hypothetical protein
MRTKFVNTSGSVQSIKRIGAAPEAFKGRRDIVGRNSKVMEAEFDSPVMLPPGRARLETEPVPAGLTASSFSELPILWEEQLHLAS